MELFFFSFMIYTYPMRNYKESQENIILAGREFTYRFVRSERRSISVEIGESGLTVRAPKRAPQKDIEQFLKSRQHWILAHYEAMLEKQKKIAAETGSNLSDIQKNALEVRYRELAREHLTKRADYYADLYHVSYRRITIREQKTRWGSCSSRGTLSFNWRLILAPPTVMDYVVAHEICHLKHMDHSPAFWAEVEKSLPDYQKYRLWLKKNSFRLQHSYEPLPYSNTST